MDKIYEGKYFYIIAKTKPNRKTPIYKIINNSGIILGEVKWFPSWRKYCFYPDSGTIWDSKCLDDLNKFLKNINKRGRNNVKDIKENI